MKEQYFREEIDLIKDPETKNNAIILINLLPDYFFAIPASSTGKYHPDFALGDGGLIRHTKVAVRIAYDMMNLEMFDTMYNDHEKDMVIVSLLLHDGLKKGTTEESYTCVDHPNLIADFVLENQDKLTFDMATIDVIVGCLRSHMGQWNTDKSGNEIMPKPKTKLQKLVHLCDYLASRRYLEAKFDSSNKLEIYRR